MTQIYINSLPSIDAHTSDQRSIQMTMVDTYSAECGGCGHVDSLKFYLKSLNTFTAMPNMDFSNARQQCGSENMKAISSDTAIEKILKRLKDELLD